MSNAGERREQVEDTPTPPMGLSWGGTLQPEQPAAPAEAATGRSEAATGPIEAGTGPLRSTQPSSAERAGPDERANSGLAELVQAEDFGRAGPAVLGGAPPGPGESSGDAGDWPTLQRRERQEPRYEERSGGPLGWIRRRRGGQ